MHARADAGAQVARAGEHVTKALVPHELATLLLDQVLNLTAVHVKSYSTCKHVNRQKFVKKKNA